MTKTLRNFAIAIGTAALYVILFLVFTDAFHAETTAELMRHLSDAFLLPACMYLGICAIHLVSIWGALDMLSYSFKLLGSLFGRRKKGAENEPRKDAYFNYVQSRRGRRFSLWHLLFPGIICFVLSTVFSVAYFNV